jgi:hypothetical protein
MVARRHHYIPQFYLKGFAVARRKTHQLVVFDCEACTTFDASTKNVAMSRDFNRVEIEGHPPDVLENALAEFESQIASALERIIAAKSIQNDEDRSYLFNLIGLLALRSPRQREIWRDFKEQIARRMLSFVTATPNRWASHIAKAQEAGYVSQDADTDYAKIREFMEDGYRIEVPTGAHIVKEMSLLDTILPYIFNRKWLLLKCQDSSAGFVTSDHPVCLTWSDPGRHGPVGFGLRGTEIVFPICNRLALVGSFEIEDDERDATDEMVAAVNGTLIHFAERHVYAGDHNFRYALSSDAARKGAKLPVDLRRLQKRRDRQTEHRGGRRLQDRG